MSGKRRISTSGPNWEDNFFYSRQLSTSRCIKTVIIFQQHFLSSTSRSTDQSNYFRKLRTLLDQVTTRSDKNACGKPMLTDHDKQATGNREPANEMNKQDPKEGIPDWWKPFTDNLENLEAHVLAHSSERANSGLEGDASKVVTQKRKHCIYTHFTKDWNCDMCLKTQIARVPCRRRNERSIPRAEKFGDLTTVEHKILNEGRESRNNHRYAVVVQDVASQWIPSYPCKTETSQETEMSSRKFLEPSKSPKSLTLNFGELEKCCELSWYHRLSTPRHSVESVSNQNFTGDGEEFTKVPIAVAAAKRYSYVKFIRIWQVLWRIIKESSNKNTSSIRDKRYSRTSYTTSKRRNISCISAIRTGW